MTEDPITLEIIEGPTQERDADGWEHYAYVVRLSRKHYRSMQIPWRQGLLRTEDPNPRDVLECLLSDASGVENAEGDFEMWASEYGLDTDSRKAEAMFRATTEQTEKLRDLLGADFRDSVFPPDGDSETAARRLAHAV